MTLQTDPQWLPARRGRLTTSRFRDARCKLKTGKRAESSITYAYELVAERVSEYAVSRFVTDAMQRGLDEEPFAVMAYEAATGNLCEPARLIAHPTLDEFLSTPDGFIGDDGLIEVKVPSVQKFVRWRAEGKVPDEHLDQLIGQQAVCRRAWTDFVAYCPEQPPEYQLFIVRFVPTAEQIEQADADAAEFLQLVDDLFIAFTHHGKAA